MKTHLTVAVLLGLIFTISVTAQVTGSDPTDVTVLEKSWHKDFISPRRDSNPLRQNEDLIQQTRLEKKEIENRDYDLPNQPTERRMPVPLPRPVPLDRRPVDVYVYKFTVKNTGLKKIKAIEWEYQFLHPDTGEVMGSRRISSKVKLAPGKTQVVEARLLQQPAMVVSASQLDKKYRDQFTERLIIHSIHYRDGTARNHCLATKGTKDTRQK